MKFAFMETEKADFPVAFMCRQLRVSRSGFYAWQKRGPCRRKQQDEAMGERIAAIHSSSRGTYGRPRVLATLRAQGVQIGGQRVGRLMRERGLAARRPRRFRCTTDSRHSFPVAPNVLGRHFLVPQPNQAWVGDITYVWTRQGWLYLAVLLDLYSRRVVGWAMSPSLERQLCLDALGMALQARRPRSGLVHHTDRGSQYASHDYRQALAAHGLVCSMSRRGDCWDNAVAESFFATLKTEMVARMDFATHEEARTVIFEFIEVFYNRRRMHSRLGYRSPVEYEALPLNAAVAA